MGLRYKKIDLTPIWDKAPIKKRIKDVPNIKSKVQKTSSDEFKKYKDRVFELTEEVKHLIDGIESRGYHKFHIDHKISIKWGFDNNIPERYIAHIDNLRMLWWKENFNKNIVCEVDEKNKWILGDLKPYMHRNDIYINENE
jgi:hypothetical protein